MRRLLLFFCGMLVGGGLVCFGFNYHVVYSSQGLVLVPKAQPALNELYADIRTWKPADWQNHPGLARSMVANGRSELMGMPGTESVHDLLRKFSNAEKADDELQLK